MPQATSMTAEQMNRYVGFHAEKALAQKKSPSRTSTVSFSPLPYHPTYTDSSSDQLPENTYRSTSRETAKQERLLENQQRERVRQKQSTQQQEEERISATKRIAQQTAQKEARKVMRVGMRRGLEYALNFLLSCLSIGTAGAGFVIAAIPYLITLTDLNLQMIWGTYVTKGKSLLFPPLEWKPLPVPLPDSFLHLGIVLIDIAVILIALVGTFVVMLMIFGQYIATAGVWVGIYAYLTDPFFQDMVNHFLGSLFSL